MITEKKGSKALTVCVKETETIPRLIFVQRLPIVCTMAKGRIATSFKQSKLQAKTRLNGKLKVKLKTLI